MTEEFDISLLYSSFPDTIEDIFIIEEEPDFVKLKIVFRNKSNLRVFHNQKTDKYSFYWLNKNNKLILGWDNAPHCPNLKTFPYHKHLPDGKIIKCKKPSLLKILKLIQKSLKPGA